MVFQIVAISWPRATWPSSSVGKLVVSQPEADPIAVLGHENHAGA
jgi:hypothetical protein